ncbi:MAG: FixH family protein [Pseudomonadota bacterium]
MYAMADQERRRRRWYQEPWVWLLIALPLTAVVGGMITIYLAVTTSDGLVVDDYYERGKAINQDLARDDAARRYGLSANLVLYQGNTLRLQLSAINGNWPETVSLSLLHPTRAGHDQAVRLRHTGAGSYQGTIEPPAEGHWYIQLEADDWRLSGTLQVPQTQPLLLVPAG